MDSISYPVTLNQLRTFHGIDRSLFTILTSSLGRDPTECLLILGLWLWLERKNFYGMTSKILSLPPFIINEFADEAVMCLKCISCHFPFPTEATEIPLTHSIVKMDISLRFFCDNHSTGFLEIQNLVNDVCRPVVSDIIERCSIPKPIIGPTYQTRTSSCVEDQLMESMSSLRIVGNNYSSPSHGQAWADEISQNARTMIVTFSKGYPVTEGEVVQFFMRLFGNCIESFQMQEELHRIIPVTK